jgi:hypothetical protein
MAPDDDPPQDDDDKDVTVKELLAGKLLSDSPLDAETQADLARWFQLPSFEDAGEQAAPPAAIEDQGVVEVRERRAKACAAVDPALLERIRVRTEVKPETLLRFEAKIQLYMSEAPTALFDYTMAERGHAIVELREIEIAEELQDDLKECTPQALLRDLHRPETEFEKLFEVVDIAAEQRLDIVAEVEAAMAMNLKLPPLEVSPFEQERRRLVEDQVIRRRPWAELPMPNRKVEE